MLVAATLALLLGAEPTPAPEMPAEAPAAPAWSFGFDRVDLLSEELGTFLHYDLPELPVYAVRPAVRFAEQVKVVFRLPWRGFHAGASIASQSLLYEHPVGPKGLHVTGGLVTRLLFPRGVVAGVAYRFGMFRVGVSLSAFSSGSWSAPGSFQLFLLPSLGLGIGTPWG